MAMPIGLRRLSGLYPASAAWAWGINGVTSVLASVLAIVLAISAGFTVATLVAGACYAVAAAHAILGAWPSETQQPEGGAVVAAPPVAPAPVSDLR
jgi:hypothetical protein